MSALCLCKQRLCGYLELFPLRIRQLFSSVSFMFRVSTNGFINNNWAASWKNQQNYCASNEDSDQPGHPPSLIRVFAVRMKKAWVLSYPLCAQRRLWSDWADAQADLSLRWAHCHFVGFDMRRLNFNLAGTLSVLYRQTRLASVFVTTTIGQRRKISKLNIYPSCLWWTE